MIDEIKSEPPFDTKRTFIDGAVDIAAGADEFAAADAQIETTADAAVGTDGFHFTGRLLEILGDERPHRTADDAFAAGFAARLGNGLIAKRTDDSLRSAKGKVDAADMLEFVAGSHTNAAKHTLIRIAIEKGITGIQGNGSAGLS